MGLFRTSKCYCGSGRDAGFCNHRAATRAGVVRNGKRANGGTKKTRGNGTSKVSKPGRPNWA